MVSVALSLGLLPVDVIHRRALRRSDFPPLPLIPQAGGRAAACDPPDSFPLILPHVGAPLQVTFALARSGAIIAASLLVARAAW